jgi:putative membrane protein
MAPFYTIIGLWVGAVTMTILLKTRMNRRRYPHITETQSFFGRYMMFFLISQIQAAIVVAGDIFLLGCTPVHPWLMWLSAAVTNMVFSLLIYALALAFGNIGIAVVFIVMFIQVSGSSGTYPIEVLPKIYESIFKFFPFPYAINAMREAICGTYDHDFVIYLVQLMPFAVLGLLVGLFIRRPFVGVLDYMTDKMNETGVL